MQMSSPEYALNEHTGTLHRYPANEACNTDAANRAGHLLRFPQFSVARKHRAYKRECFRCFGR